MKVADASKDHRDMAARRKPTTTFYNVKIDTVASSCRCSEEQFIGCSDRSLLERSPPTVEMTLVKSLLNTVLKCLHE